MSTLSGWKGPCSCLHVWLVPFKVPWGILLYLVLPTSESILIVLQTIAEVSNTLASHLPSPWTIEFIPEKLSHGRVVVGISPVPADGYMTAVLPAQDNSHFHFSAYWGIWKYIQLLVLSFPESNCVADLQWKRLGKKADGKSFASIDLIDFVWCHWMYSLYILLWYHVLATVRLVFLCSDHIRVEGFISSLFPPKSFYDSSLWLPLHFKLIILIISC